MEKEREKCNKKTVRLSENTGLTIRHIAEELGLNPPALRGYLQHNRRGLLPGRYKIDINAAGMAS